MSQEVFVQLENHSWMSFSGPPCALSLLYDTFTYQIYNYKFTQAYKRSKGKWNGYTHLFKKKGGFLYVGLLYKAAAVLRQNNYKVTIHPNVTQRFMSLEDEDVQAFIEEVIKPPFTARDDQIRAIKEGFKLGRRTLLSPTASGKSFIAYCLLRLFQEYGVSSNKKAMYIVPNLGLVEQTYKAFKEYSEKDDGFDIETVTTNPKEFDDDPKKKTLIINWQAIVKNEEKWFHQFSAVIGDEVHHFKAKSLTYIMENSINAAYRWGLTGTLEDVEVNKMIIEGHFGGVYRVSSTSKLIQDGKLSEMEPIELIHLNYKPEDRRAVRKEHKEYAEEIDFLCQHEGRNSAILNTVSSLEGNTLVLFLRVNHGKKLFKRFESDLRFESTPLYFIDGSIDKEPREQIRQDVNKSKESIILGSVGTMSTGVDIPNLNNLVLVMPGKAKIKLLQSIGRILRKSEDGRSSRVIDFVDDLMKSNKPNHSLRHAQKRVEIYQKEGFPLSFSELKL